jgi:hypothetical protein
MTTELDTRVLRLKTELDDHARIARHLGLDFERPIRSLGDGYPENAIAWVGKITERLLKRLWRHHNVPGSPAGRTLHPVRVHRRQFSFRRTHVRSRRASTHPRNYADPTAGCALKKPAPARLAGMTGHDPRHRGR